MDSPCAGNQAGRGRALRADIVGAAAAYSTITENDLHARRTSLFFCLLLHLTAANTCFRYIQISRKIVQATNYLTHLYVYNKEQGRRTKNTTRGLQPAHVCCCKP
jgi:hypothetical protein